MCLWLQNEDKQRNIHLKIIIIILKNIWEYFRIFSLELVISLRGQHCFALCKWGAQHSPKEMQRMQWLCFKVYLKWCGKLWGEGGTSPWQLLSSGHKILMVLLVPAPTCVPLHPPASQGLAAQPRGGRTSPRGGTFPASQTTHLTSFSTRMSWGMGRNRKITWALIGKGREIANLCLCHSQTPSTAPKAL